MEKYKVIETPSGRVVLDWDNEDNIITIKDENGEDVFKDQIKMTFVNLYDDKILVTRDVVNGNDVVIHLKRVGKRINTSRFNKNTVLESDGGYIGNIFNSDVVVTYDNDFNKKVVCKMTSDINND